jgi:phosphatidylinositol 4-kinase
MEAGSAFRSCPCHVQGQAQALVSPAAAPPLQVGGLPMLGNGVVSAAAAAAPGVLSPTPTTTPGGLSPQASPSEPNLLHSSVHTGSSQEWGQVPSKGPPSILQCSNEVRPSSQGQQGGSQGLGSSQYVGESAGQQGEGTAAEGAGTASASATPPPRDPAAAGGPAGLQQGRPPPAFHSQAVPPPPLPRVSREPTGGALRPAGSLGGGHIEVPPCSLRLDPGAEEGRRKAWAVYGERWAARTRRLQRESPHARRQGWALRCVIVKSGDDCRQVRPASPRIATFPKFLSL